MRGLGLLHTWTYLHAAGGNRGLSPVAQCSPRPSGPLRTLKVTITASPTRPNRPNPPP